MLLDMAGAEVQARLRQCCQEALKVLAGYREWHMYNSAEHSACRTRCCCS